MFDRAVCVKEFGHPHETLLVHAGRVDQSRKAPWLAWHQRRFRLTLNINIIILRWQSKFSLLSR
jgi:hypothetical protein